MCIYADEDYAHRCPNCGAHTPMPEWNGKYCTQCGTRQFAMQKTATATRTCRLCGASASMEAKFCPDCGAKLKEVNKTIPKYRE